MNRPISYPHPLRAGDLIAVTAPSAGVNADRHHRLHQARQNVEALGYRVVEGATIWSSQKCVSAPAPVRAAELMRYLTDPDVRAIIPPWGGEFLMEILPLLDWEQLRRQEPKWLLGYSDTSTLLFAYTLLTGHATAHGTNYIDLHYRKWDDLTARWPEVLGTPAGGQTVQSSSTHFQSSYERASHEEGYFLDTPTRWKRLGSEDAEQDAVAFSGRLLGGCLETVLPLLGTPYAPVHDFLETYARDTGAIWYLESSARDAADIYRALWQMKMAGWFHRCNGLLIGRTDGYSPAGDFELTDALHAACDDLNIPVLYDVDIGHIPPQLHLINGAFATVSYQEGRGQLVTEYR